MVDCVCRCDEPLKSPAALSASSAGSARSLVSDNDYEDTASVDEGDVDIGKYNEDGSFVGAYTTDQPTRQRGRVYDSRANAYV